MPGLPTIEAYRLPRTEDLPANRQRWSLDPERCVLLLHDPQEYFLRPYPNTMRRELVENLVALRQFADNHAIPVAYTAQPGGMDRSERGLLHDIWGDGMSKDPEDTAVEPAIRPRPSDWTFVKWRYSAFHRTELLQQIRNARRTQLVIAGVYAHVGIITTALESYSNDLETFLVADALGDFSPEDHAWTLRYAATNCASVVTTEEVLDHA